MMQTKKRKTLGGLAGSLLLVAWGCSVGESELGSNQAGGAAGGSGADDGTGAEDGSGATSGGSDSAQAGASHGGSGAAAGRANGGTAGSTDPGAAGAGAAPLSGGSGGTDAGAPGSGGSAGTPACDCPYPPILGGDCCTARDACETEGVECELLRSSIAALRASDEPEDAAESDAYHECISKLSDALVERCAFVEPECAEPAEDFATFGEDGGRSECTESETRELLRCGEPGSYYGPDCCQRQRCLEDSECASGRCVYRRVQSAFLDPNATPHISSCEVLERGCDCSGDEVGEPHNGYCIGADEEIERFDCDVSGKTCEELLDWSDVLHDRSSQDDDIPAAADDDYEACATKILNEVEARCSPKDRCDIDCEEPFECQACQDGSPGTSWVCLEPNVVC
jgi:hypothetical protein